MKRILLGLVVCVAINVCSAAETSAASPSKANPRKFAHIALGNPRGIAVDSKGNLYVGDVDSGTIFKITPAGEAMAVPHTDAVKDPIGIAVDAAGTLFIADADGNQVFKLPANGPAIPVGKATGSEPGYSTPTSVAADAKGNVFVTDNGGASVRKISSDGVLTTFAGKSGQPATKDGNGTEARFISPRGIAADPAGNLYVADEGANAIRKIAADGAVTTLAGGQAGNTDGRGAEARFGGPRALAVDRNGTVYVADTDNHTIRKIAPTGAVITLAGKPGESGKADGKGAEARFNEPRAITVDTAGIIYVADSSNGLIRQITPDGVVTTVAGNETKE